MEGKLLTLSNWKGSRMSIKYSDSCLECLEEKAERYHNEIDEINKHVVLGFYQLKTVIYGWEKTNHYKLKLKIKYHENKSKQKHKKNTHDQKIYV